MVRNFFILLLLWFPDFQSIRRVEEVTPGDTGEIDTRFADTTKIRLRKLNSYLGKNFNEGDAVSLTDLRGSARRSGRTRRAWCASDVDDKALVQNLVTRVNLRPNRLVIELAKMKGAKAKRRTTSQRLEVQWRKPSATRRREILLPETLSSHSVRPIRSENRALLVTSIAKGRRWLNELKTEPVITVDAIARRERCSARKVNMTISLPFLRPTWSRQPLKAVCPMEWVSRAFANSLLNGPANTACSV